MAKDKGDKKDKGAKKKKGDPKKGKGKKGGAGASIASHPRAGAQVRRAKGLGGLFSFAIAAGLSLQAGIQPFDVGVRALAAGVIGYLVAWAISVTVWRHLVLAELRALVEGGQLTPAPASDPEGEPVATKTKT